MITNIADVTEHNLQEVMKQLAQRLNLENIEEALYFPRYYQVETVRVCNARCPFCPVDEWDKSVPVMAEDLFEKIASEMAGYADWIQAVWLQRAGEPLLDKKIVPHVRRMKDAGIKWVGISTNASMLTEKIR